MMKCFFMQVKIKQYKVFKKSNRNRVVDFDKGLSAPNSGTFNENCSNITKTTIMDLKKNNFFRRKIYNNGFSYGEGYYNSE